MLNQFNIYLKEDNTEIINKNDNKSGPIKLFTLVVTENK